MANIESIHFPLSLLRVLLKEHKGDQLAAAKSASKLITWAGANMAIEQWQEQCEAFKILVVSDPSLGYDEDYNHALTTAQRILNLDRDEIAGLVEDGSLPYHCQTELEAARSGYDAMRIQFGGSALTASDWKENRDMYQRWNMLMPGYEKDAWVRVHRNIVWDVVKGAWKWEEFALYCAILSKIGRKTKPVRITYGELIARATGYRSARLMSATTAKPLLTVAKIRYRLTKWDGRKLVETFSQARGRARWYWLPWRTSEVDAMEYIGGLIRKGSEHSAKQELRRAAVDKIAGIQRPPEPPASDDGGTPASWTPPPAPAPASNPAIDPAGVLTTQGHQWYTQRHLEQSLGDAPELLQQILSEFERLEFNGETYYSASKRRVIA